MAARLSTMVATHCPATVPLRKLRITRGAYPTAAQSDIRCYLTVIIMAGEIWGMLKRGELTNAANLTADQQAVSLVAWLCKL